MATVVIHTILKRFLSGGIKREEWRRDGLLHRDNDLPAKIRYHSDGVIMQQTWYQNGQRHREADQPAKIRYYENKRLRLQRWYVNGRLHREQCAEDPERPATIYYNRSDAEDVIESQVWYAHGFVHRDHDLPTVIVYTDGGSIAQEIWCSQGTIHRDHDLPAKITYAKDGSVRMQWYQDRTLQREVVIQPELALEDFVKPGSSNVVPSPQTNPLEIPSTEE